MFVWPRFLANGCLTPLTSPRPSFAAVSITILRVLEQKNDWKQLVYVRNFFVFLKPPFFVSQYSTTVNTKIVKIFLWSCPKQRLASTSDKMDRWSCTLRESVNSKPCKINIFLKGSYIFLSSWNSNIDWRMCMQNNHTQHSCFTYIMLARKPNLIWPELRNWKHTFYCIYLFLDISHEAAEKLQILPWTG